jgi:asparagine synthetase B (glutamine-hydrolysing)
VRQDLPRLVWLAEELAGREEALLQYQVERCLMAQEEVVVAGHGADMVFGGMPRHRLVRMAEKIPLAKRGLTELFQQTQSGASPASVAGKAASLLLYRGRDFPPPSVRGASGTSRVFEPSSLNDFIEHTVCEMPEFHFHAGVQGTCAVEPVTPFLGNAVLDHALTIPAELKTTVRRQKIVLRDALAPLLPDSIRTRGKAIQRVRHDRALSRVIDAMADRLLDEASVRQRDLIDPDYVSRLRQRGQEDVYSGDRLKRLWMLLVGEIWCRTFVDNRGRSPIDLSGA